MRHDSRTASVVEESLLFQKGEIGLRDGEVVLAHVTPLGEDLRQVREAVFRQQTFGKLRLFALGPQFVDLGGQRYSRCTFRSEPRLPAAGGRSVRATRRDNPGPRW